jgi:hypothetical protein
MMCVTASHPLWEVLPVVRLYAIEGRGLELSYRPLYITGDGWAGGLIVVGRPPNLSISHTLQNNLARMSDEAKDKV